MVALEWADINQRKGQLRIDESAWQGVVTASPWTWKMVFGAADRISRRAWLNKHGVHILRHTIGDGMETAQRD